ncbi:MAG: hypothetical protein QGF00_29170 [Planctomycetota bacterium]|nr:hypothetical protein [Planctomycetota bacterium]MDP7253706.1 hypothetical protein [Planctomycetota bacterium]
MKRYVPALIACTWILLGLCGYSLAETEKKPAVLFLTNPVHRHSGGAYLRLNMARLDKLGYRVAYYSYRDFYRKDAGLTQSFDVVVMLGVPGLDWSGTKELWPDTVKLYGGIRKHLAAGGGLMVFSAPQIWGMKAFDALMKPYGIRPLSGCFVDEDPTLTTHGVLNCAYTTEITRHPLCRETRGLWYPVGQRAGGTTNFDTLRNANTVPFDVDKNWTALAAIGATTSFKHFGANEGADDPWLQQERFTKLDTQPAPLVAVREKVEGKGRLAACAINAVFSDFYAGNLAYNGLCTGKGVKGKRSDLDRLLMNVLDWLGQESIAARRDTMKQSDRESFSLPPFKFPEPRRVTDSRPFRPNTDQFRGIIGARSRYSGGKSTVQEYAVAARKLGIQYLAFLEDFASLDLKGFDQFKKECEANSDDKLLLLPGIRIQSERDIWYFGFRKGIELPQEGFLKPGTRKLAHHLPQPGQYQWVRNNGARYDMACGNFRLEEKMPSGIPPEDYNVLNPFVSIYTYRNGKLVDTMMDTYLKCAARTEWVSPMAVHLIDSAEELRREWSSDHFKTVYLRETGQGLKGFDKGIGDLYASAPITYVTNGPRIDEWRSSGFDFAGGWWDWTRYRWFIKMAVSSEAGIKEVRVMNGQRLIRRFLAGGAKRFEHTLVMSHNDMNNLIMIATDGAGRQAISDEEWGKNQLFQLTWCSDRNNIPGGYSGLPAPKSASGSTAGNYSAPGVEKSGFRESLAIGVNMDRSRLPGFDGQPYRVAHVTPAPVVLSAEGSEGASRSARDIGRDISSPDVAIMTARCRLAYDRSIKKVHPWLKGPLSPMQFFHVDMRYVTFSHAGHLPAPVILEGRIKFLRDVSFKKSGRPIGVRILTMSTNNPLAGYDTAVIMHSRTGNLVTRISYVGEPTSGAQGAFNRGAYAYFYPGPFGSVGVMSLDDDLSFRYYNRYLFVGYDMRGKSIKAGDELEYRVLVFTSGFDELPSTRLPEALRNQLGMNEKGDVGYTVKTEHGSVTSRQYILRIDGKGAGFAGEITLPPRFPASLPVVIEKLNDRWTSVLYDRKAKKLRPLGMHDNKAYCHRAPTERSGRIFIGHPFTLNRPEMFLSVVQTREAELTMQIHNPTDKAASVRVTRSPFFDFVNCTDSDVEIEAGRSAEFVLKGKSFRRVF